MDFHLSSPLFRFSFSHALWLKTERKLSVVKEFYSVMAHENSSMQSTENFVAVIFMSLSIYFSTWQRLGEEKRFLYISDRSVVKLDVLPLVHFINTQNHLFGFVQIVELCKEIQEGPISFVALQCLVRSPPNSNKTFNRISDACTFPSFQKLVFASICIRLGI